MRRIITLIVVLLLMFGLAACGSKTKKDVSDDTPTVPDDTSDDTGDEFEPSSGAISRIRADTPDLEPIPGENPEVTLPPGTEPPEEKEDAEIISDEIDNLGDQGEEEEITETDDLDDEDTNVDFGDDII